MINRALAFTLCLQLALWAGCRSPEITAARSGSAGTYQNPVLDKVFADPGVLRARDGTYFCYSTCAREGDGSNIRLAKSRDLVNWELLPDALPILAPWAGKAHEIWAPDVSEHDGKFYMYFASDTIAGSGMCLGTAVAQKPEGPFAPSAEPLICGPSFINIDPMAFDDPVTGRKLLYWGSGFEAIKVRELADDRLHFKPGSQPVEVVKPISEPGAYQSLVEGVWVIKRNEYYYIFYSGNNCCGTNAHYAVMVARSKSALGPFETLADATGRADSTILVQNDYWRAPGHNAIATDDAGQDWIVYHAVRRRPATETPGVSGEHFRRVLLIDRIVYRDGWPAIEGGQPSHAPRPGPVIKAGIFSRRPVIQKNSPP